MELRKRDVFFTLAIAEFDAVAFLLIFWPKFDLLGRFAIFFKLIWLWLPILFLLGIIVAKYLGVKWPVFWQIGKSFLVGTSNGFVDILLLYFLQMLAGVNMVSLYPWLKSISFGGAVINSFAWNKIWAFEDGANGEYHKQGPKFAAVMILGAILNISLATALVRFVSPPALFDTQSWGIVSAIISACIVFIWDFLGYKFIVFKK